MCFVRFSFLLLLSGSFHEIVSSSRKFKESELIRIPLETTHYKPIPKYSNFRAQGVSIDLENGNNVGYSGIIRVGTPGQKLRVDFDTGSSDLWVSSSFVCAFNKEYCSKHNLYDFTKSNTFENSLGGIKELAYGSETDKVIISRDIIEIGPGLKIKQEFGQLINTDLREDANFEDGIFGLSYPIAGHISNTSNAFTNLVNQGVLKRGIFSFYLNRSAGKKYSELVLGGYDPKHYIGNLTFTPVVKKRLWLIKLDTMLFGRHEITTLKAILDTGSTLVIGPPEVVYLIWNTTGVFGHKEIPCSNLDIGNMPNVTFVINKKRFVLTAHDYVMRVAGSKGCRSGFASDPRLSIDKSFILGDIFLRKFYTVFDMENDRVGFAVAA